MGIHFGLRNSPGHHQLVYIQGVPEKMVHSDFFTLRRELESTSISGQSRTFFFGNFVDWAPTRANFLFKKTCFQAFLNIFFPSKQLCNTLRWSTDRSWTWEQGLTNASLLVGEILSKNSWQWANLLWTNSVKATMYFQINAPLYCTTVLKGKICLKTPENRFFNRKLARVGAQFTKLPKKGPGLATDRCRLVFSSECKEIAMHHFFWDTLYFSLI